MTFSGPNGKQVAQRVTENGINGFKVDYTPTVGGKTKRFVTR
jgi:phage terminase large subunit-like protein